MMSHQNVLPQVIADGPLAPTITDMLYGKVSLLPWDVFTKVPDEAVDGIYTYGHLELNGTMLDRLPDVKVISNYGVGVDHINLEDAAARSIPVGNTPGILDGATADMAMALMLAGARRLVEGDRYARSSKFTRYDPGFMLGREVHHATLGIVGLGRIGCQIAKRALGFDMTVLYHNRRQRADVEQSMPVRYVSFDEILSSSDFLILTVPLTEETRGLIGGRELVKMKPTAILVNVSRGPVVDTSALTDALQQEQIYAAALDVTDPEPLPREHPLLLLDNVTIVPHLGSATEQTRQTMAEISVRNLLNGLRGEPLVHEVRPS